MFFPKSTIKISNASKQDVVRAIKEVISEYYYNRVVYEKDKKIKIKVVDDKIWKAVGMRIIFDFSNFEKS